MKELTPERLHEMIEKIWIRNLQQRKQAKKRAVPISGTARFLTTNG